MAAESPRRCAYLPAPHDADAMKLPRDARAIVSGKPPLCIEIPHNLVDVVFGHHHCLVVAQEQPPSP